MGTKITYKEDHIKINTMCVIVNFDNESKTYPMEKVAEEWEIEIILLPGEYSYFFLINDTIVMNDPKANLYELNDKNEIVSKIIINENKERLYNITQYKVEIEEYLLEKYYFNIKYKEEISLEIKLKELTGLHTISCLWYDPSGQIYLQKNLPIVQSEKHIKALVFTLDSNKNMEVGYWRLKIFRNGRFIFEEKFLVDNRENKKYLPIGTAVKLQGADKNLMIYGIAQLSKEGKVYDYVGCPYPEGNISEETTFLFNHEDIESVYYMGHITKDGVAFQTLVDEMIQNSQIVKEV